MRHIELAAEWRRRSFRREVAPIPVDRAARRQFSFSRLTGQLVRTRAHCGLPTSWLEHDAANDRMPTDSTPAASARWSTTSWPASTSATPTDIADWCEHLAPQLCRSKCRASAAASACEMIERFAASPRGRQLADAAALHREIEFLLAWPPDGAPIAERPATFQQASSTACTKTPTATGASSTTKPTTSRPPTSRATPNNTKCNCTSTPWPPSTPSANRPPN